MGGQLCKTVPRLRIVENTCLPYPEPESELEGKKVVWLEMTILEILLDTNLNECVYAVLLKVHDMKRASQVVNVNGRHAHVMDCMWTIPVSLGDQLVVGMVDGCGGLVAVLKVPKGDEDDIWVPLYQLSTKGPNSDQFGQLSLTFSIDGLSFTFRITADWNDLQCRLWVTECKHRKRRRMIADCFRVGDSATIDIHIDTMIVEVMVNKRIVGWCEFAIEGTHGHLKAPLQSCPTLIGQVRLSVKWRETDRATLPLSDYLPLSTLITNHHRHLADLLSTRKCDYHDSLIKAIINQQTNADTAIPFLSHLIGLHLDGIEENTMNLVFRDNSFATKAVDYYQRRQGEEYCKCLFALYHSRIRASGSPASVIESVKILLECVIQVQLPQSIRVLYSRIRYQVNQRFPRPSVIHIHAITSFMFIRLILPGLLNPAMFGGVCDHDVDNKAVARVWGKLASLADFDESSPEASLYNDAIKTMHAQVCIIVMQSSEGVDGKLVSTMDYSDHEQQSDLHTLHMYLSLQLSKYPPVDNENHKRSSTLSTTSTLSSTHSLLRHSPIDINDEDDGIDIVSWWRLVGECVNELNDKEKRLLECIQRTADEAVKELRRLSQPPRS